MTLAGKIVIAKDRSTISAIRANVPYNDKGRYTGDRISVEPGSLYLCVKETMGNPNLHRMKGLSATPFLLLIHGEMTWEALPNSFETIQPSEKLKGHSICFTGKSDRSRQYWKAFVELHGGSFSSSVDSGTTLLVMESLGSNSTKAMKAARIGTERMTYDDFTKMVTELPSNP
jgi:NAD-dependent DNA ligase